MKYFSSAGIILILVIVTIACRNNKEGALPTPIAIPRKDSLLKAVADTIILQETFKEDDDTGSEYLSATLEPIRANFKRINHLTKWTAIKEHELWESAEGGEAKFYYAGKTLEKISTRHFGETYQQLTEYYLFNQQLSFVFEKGYRYNRPMYYDSAAMKESGDTEAFHFDSSSIEETRNYFQKGVLLHQLSNQDCPAPYAKEYLLEEQKRILDQYKKLMKLVK